MKKILGIAALLAVVAMGLAFTACDLLGDKNDEPVFVTFTNNTAIDIKLTFKGLPPLDLTKGTMTKGNSVVVEGKGSIVLQTITFSDKVVDDNPENYIIVSGALVAGKKQKKDVVGISLAGGELIFSPDQNTPSAASWKINVIPPNN